MRVISLVPSWTETLLEAGVDVIGRTRFCVHPKKLVKTIPAIGGTKDWNWEKIVELRPDLILLDREENPKFMAEQNLILWHATHITSVHDLPNALDSLSHVLSNSKLNEMSERWRAVLEKEILSTKPDLTSLPGIIEWGRRPAHQIQRVIYMIWKDPWMAASKTTFIGSVFDLLGVSLTENPEKYPKINLEDFDPTDTLLLFSSEPYPFLRQRSALASLPFAHAFVDGESFSWFGIRTLNFLS